MPPLDRDRFAADRGARGDARRASSRSPRDIEMPAAAAAALARVTRRRSAGARRDGRAPCSPTSIPVEALAEHVFVAAALQVHFARLAAGLDAAALVPVGDGACPGLRRPAGRLDGRRLAGAHGARFCGCALCGTLWNYVRIKCTLCGSTKGIGYQEIEGGAGTVKAETCDACRGYVKILHQNKDPALDPVADDVATLGLDL